MFLDIAVRHFTTTEKTLRGSAALSQHCSPPNHPTARRGCPSWHASFAGASSSARVLQQQDARHPLTDYQANRLVDHHRLRILVPNRPGEHEQRRHRGPDPPQAFGGKNISWVLIIYRKKG